MRPASASVPPMPSAVACSPRSWWWSWSWWYRDHPELFVVNYIRFNDFAAGRHESNLVQTMRSGGLLKPLRDTERELEQTRMLAERGLYLGSRYPALSGSMIEVWLSRLLDDLHGFSSTADRLVSEVEQLPEAVAAERSAAIEQFMAEVSAERHRTLEDLFNQEERFRNLLAELQETVRVIEELLVTGDALAARLGFEPGERKEVESGIVTFQKSMVEVSKSAQDLAVVVDGLNELVSSPNWQAFMPAFNQSVDRVESAGEVIVGHTLRNGVILLVVWLILYIIGKLVVHYLLTRVLGERPATS